jgi:ATP-binding cassette, subfamily C, bacterial LapB
MTFLSPTIVDTSDTNWGRETQYAACISPLLNALGWRGDAAQVMEAMPHFSSTMDLLDFRSSLANLNFESKPTRSILAELDIRLMPCLFDSKGGSVFVLFSADDNTIQAFDAATQSYVEITKEEAVNIVGTAFFFRPIDREKIGQWSTGRRWFQSVLARFMPLIRRILLMTFLLNLLALATPLFIMAVYDLVIGSGSFDTLNYLLVGVGLALLCDIGLRYMRGTMLAYIGARLDYIIGSAVLQKILSLPTAQTERTSLGSKMARFREFDMIREFFIGPMAIAFLEFPFIFVFLIAIGILGGNLVLVPLSMLFIYGLVGFIIFPAIQQRVTQNIASTASKSSFITESLSSMRVIKQLGAEEIWLDRYRDISSVNARSNLRNGMVAASAQTFAHVLMVTSGVLTLAFGISQVFDGTMSVGALVATMALVWRLLAPTQTLFLAFTKLQQVSISVKRLNQLFTMPSERNPYTSSALKEFDGAISFSRVSFRYSTDQDPAVMGVDIKINPGEVVAFAGGNSSGKSTLVKLLLGMYQPQVGGITIDGIDIRQIDPLDLRRSIGYMPQTCELFHGTIRQNLLLANSVASEEQVVEACEWANLTSDIDALPDKLDTRIGDQIMRQLPAGFQQRLIMARAFLTNAKIMIFDEPGNMLDDEGDQAFLDAIERMRGKATIIIVTHRPSHMRAADKVVLMKQGMVRAVEPAASIIPKIIEGA